MLCMCFIFLGKFMPHLARRNLFLKCRMYQFLSFSALKIHRLILAFTRNIKPETRNLTLSTDTRHSTLVLPTALKYNSGPIFTSVNVSSRFQDGCANESGSWGMNAALMLDQPIVVVEDDAGMSKAIERLLRAAGFQPVSFVSAEELLQTEAADSAACLVLDIHLPGLSGLELARLLIGSGHAKPIIFITGQDEAPLRDEARRLGCPYFRKPFEGKALLEAIRVAVTVDP
jgi:CheY-like chemotaxis protein